MKRMNDMQTRLFYGACTHAKIHTESLVEFSAFNNNKKMQSIIDKVFTKVKAFQLGRIDTLDFSAMEWKVCREIIISEGKLLKRLSEQGVLSSDGSSEFLRALDILEAAYK